jgi:hypothetical protein
VVITGTGYADGTVPTAVTIGGVAVTSFVVDSDTRITAVVQAGTLGKKDIVVTDAGGNGTGTNLFTYKTNVSATLVVNVTATIARVLSLVWTANTLIATVAQTEGATGTLTWPLSNMTMTQIKTTSVGDGYGIAGYDFQIRNTGNSTAIITGTVADTTGSNNWTAAAVVASNTYYMGVHTGALNSATPTWNSLHAGYILNGNVAIDGTQNFELKFQTPSAISVAADFGVQHTLAVTMTATAGP